MSRHRAKPDKQKQELQRGIKQTREVHRALHEGDAGERKWALSQMNSWRARDGLKPLTLAELPHPSKVKPAAPRQAPPPPDFDANNLSGDAFRSMLELRGLDTSIFTPTRDTERPGTKEEMEFELGRLVDNLRAGRKAEGKMDAERERKLAKNAIDARTADPQAVRDHLKKMGVLDPTVAMVFQPVEKPQPVRDPHALEAERARQHDARVRQGLAAKMNGRKTVDARQLKPDEFKERLKQLGLDGSWVEADGQTRVAEHFGK